MWCISVLPYLLDSRRQDPAPRAKQAPDVDEWDVSKSGVGGEMTRSIRTSAGRIEHASAGIDPRSWVQRAGMDR